MSVARVERRGPAELNIIGDLTFRTVMHVRESLEAELAGVTETQVVDLSGIQHTDSSALSLWLCMRRQAHVKGLELSVVNVPDEIRALGQLVGMSRQWIDAAHDLTD